MTKEWFGHDRCIWRSRYQCLTIQGCSLILDRGSLSLNPWGSCLISNCRPFNIVPFLAIALKDHKAFMRGPGSLQVESILESLSLIWTFRVFLTIVKKCTRLSILIRHVYDLSYCLMFYVRIDGFMAVLRIINFCLSCLLDGAVWAIKTVVKCFVIHYLLISMSFNSLLNVSNNLMM